jgi:hypothetical protein
VAESGGSRKRLKDIKKEMVELKARLTALKTERDQLKEKIAADKAAKGTDKPA